MGKRNDKDENLRRALVDSGVSEEDAAEFVGHIGQYVETGASGERSAGEGNGQEFAPGRPPRTNGARSRMDVKDLVEFLVKGSPDRLVDNSEIPTSMLIDAVRVMSEDEICRVGFTGSPVEVVLKCFLKCMIARDRKRVKEVVELVQSMGETGGEDMFKQGAFGI